MGSYFVDRRAQPTGEHQIHDRDVCPPASFPPKGEAEYLGEFQECAQAMVVARLRYQRVAPCPWCAVGLPCGEPEPADAWARGDHLAHPGHA